MEFAPEKNLLESPFIICSEVFFCLYWINWCI